MGKAIYLAARRVVEAGSRQSDRVAVARSGYKPAATPFGNDSFISWI